MDDELTQMTVLAATLLQRRTWSQSAPTLVSWLDSLQLLATQIAALQAGVVHELSGQDWAREHGASSMRAWTRDHLRVSIHTAKRLCDLGAQMDARPLIRDAVAAGAVAVDQAAVIDAALAGLPEDLDRELVDRCEASLLAHAAVFEPHRLAVLGQRVLDHVAPEIAEAALHAKLERDEQQALRTRTFVMSAQGAGRVRLSGWLDSEGAAIVRAALDPFCKPVPGPDGARDPRTAGQRRADALVEVCRLDLTSDRLPDNGGHRPQMHVTVDFDTLTNQLSTGTLDNGDLLSPATVRRLACDAAIIPAVLGSDSEVLDLGRTRRLYAGAARRALVLRDRGCAFPSCDRPPSWCQAHHIVSWLDGGPTDLDNGVLLCAFHHRLVHHSGWEIKLGSNRRPVFIPPAHVDLRQRPLTNTYHRRL
jgi:hypothetical protein